MQKAAAAALEESHLSVSAQESPSGGLVCALGASLSERKKSKLFKNRGRTQIDDDEERNNDAKGTNKVKQVGKSDVAAAKLGSQDADAKISNIK